MHHVIAWAIVGATAVLMGGCTEPVGPRPRDVGRPAPAADLARHRPEPPASLPDSVGVFPPPIPPIYEEVPLLDDPE
jgi:hypothetical protein